MSPNTLWLTRVPPSGDIPPIEVTHSSYWAVKQILELAAATGTPSHRPAPETTMPRPRQTSHRLRLTMTVSPHQLATYRNGEPYCVKFSDAVVTPSPPTLPTPTSDSLAPTPAGPTTDAHASQPPMSRAGPRASDASQLSSTVTTVSPPLPTANTGKPPLPLNTWCLWLLKRPSPALASSTLPLIPT